MSDSQRSIDWVMQGLRQRDSAAAHCVVERFSAELLRRLSGRFSPELRRRADPDDVLQSAFGTFFRHAAAGEYAYVDSWQKLIGLLVCITLRKCADVHRHHTTQGRDAGAEVALDWGLLNREPTAEEEVQARDLLDAVTRDLSARDRVVIELRVLGHSPAEIARHEQVRCSERSVYRIIEIVQSRLERL